MPTAIGGLANRTRAADEVWLATARLHRRYPAREDFTIEEIVQEVASENLTGMLRPGVRIHAYLHCVANKAPNPARYRMLLATGPNTRRLWRPGDTAHPARRGKTMPERDEIPERCHELLDWYETQYIGRRTEGRGTQDPILALRGVGAEIWAGQSADRYVQDLREGWD